MSDVGGGKCAIEIQFQDEVSLMIECLGALCVVIGNAVLILSGRNWPWSYTRVLYFSECGAAAYGAEHLEGRDVGDLRSSHRSAALIDSSCEHVSVALSYCTSVVN